MKVYGAELHAARLANVLRGCVGLLFKRLPAAIALLLTVWALTWLQPRIWPSRKPAHCSDTMGPPMMGSAVMAGDGKSISRYEVLDGNHILIMVGPEESAKYMCQVD